MNEKVKEAIMNLYRQGSKVKPYKDWKADLFDAKNSQQDITNYIYDRFKTATNEVEFYTAMIFLVHKIPDDELFISYQESPQHLMILEGEMIDHESADARCTDDHTLNINIINTIQAIQAIKVIGE